MSAAASVQDVLSLVQTEIRKGRHAEARQIANAYRVPLGLNIADLRMGSKIAEGAESTVYAGRFMDQDVAIKKYKISTSDDLVRYKRELAIMATLDHPNIIRLLGARALPPDYALVTPLQQQSLHDLLYTSGWRPGWTSLLVMCSSLANALAAMHEKGILHRDLKPRNVLMGNDGIARLCDFGIAKYENEEDDIVQEVSGRRGRAPSGGFYKRSMVGTLEYMAPEVLLHQPHSRAADVYAFAVTMNELATGIFPFSDCTRDNPEVHTVLEMGYGRQELAAAVAAEGLRPSVCKHCPVGYRDLMADCWNREPEMRPTFHEVARRLNDIHYHLVSQGMPAPARPSLEIRVLAGLGFSEEESSQEDEQAGVVHLSSRDPYGSSEGDDGSSVTMTYIDVPSPCSAETKDHTTAMELDELASPRTVLTYRESPHDMEGYLPVVSAGAFETQGVRETMEDRHVLQSGTSGPHLFAVFDGHRGQEAAEYASRVFPRMLSQFLPEADSVEAALAATFLEVDYRFQEEWSQDTVSRIAHHGGEERYPGCTALAAMVVGRRLLLANAGDSRAILCRNGEAMALTRDHTGADDQERERIVSSGGLLRWRHGSWRIGEAGLQVTRSLGDFDVKSQGVIAVPEVRELDLQAGDAFLVLASDGLWDTISNEEVVGLVRDTVKQPEMCAKRLAMEAFVRGSRDNITVVVVFLQPVSSLEQVFSQGKESWRATPTCYGSRGPVADEMGDTY